MSETKYDQYSTPCLLVGPNATPNPVKDASSAVFAGAAMKRESGIGSDLSTKHPRHVACFAVFNEAVVGWESGTGLHLATEPPRSGTSLHLATEPPRQGASSAVLAGAAMTRESGIGSDLATEPPCYIACFVVFAEAAIWWERVQVHAWPLILFKGL